MVVGLSRQEEAADMSVPFATFHEEEEDCQIRLLVVGHLL